MTHDTSMDDFTLGEPALVCRWRLAHRTLPLGGRHLRALSARSVNGERIDQGLVIWARQHLEQTLMTGASAYPDGVLMLMIDPQGQASMTVGPFERLKETSLSCLVDRSERAHAEAERTGVSPETLWIVRGNVLISDDEPATAPSGIVSLVEGLARTLGMPLRRDSTLRERVRRGHRDFDEAFLVSDEYGVVPALEYNGPTAQRFVGGYEHLCSRDSGR